MGAALDGPDGASAGHPLFQGVSSLFFWGANPVLELDPEDPWTTAMLAHEAGRMVGRVAVSEVQVGRAVVLRGTVSDDGLPDEPEPALTWSWQVVSGPGRTWLSPAAAPASAHDTVMRASLPGTYVVRLSASDGASTSAAEVTVTFE